MRTLVPTFWRAEQMPEREVWKLTPRAAMWYIEDWENRAA